MLTTASSHKNILATRYRPEIDGLRALAVLAVLFYHVGLGCPGGYVGVDVFFVISGYLITGLIVRDIKNGSFSMVNFWERRVRRIFPALSVCVVVTLFAGWFLLLPEALGALGEAALSQAFLVANVYFWRTTNYFGSVEELPLLHTWSLAVEEQFYLVAPLLLLLLYRFSSRRFTGNLACLITMGVLVSLALAVWGVKTQPFATFYLLPTRAWELLCGSLVAVVPLSAVPSSRWKREFVSWAGLTGVLFPIWMYSSETPFPGLAAVPPCIGTALIIWANGDSARDERKCATSLSVLLSLRPITFVGLISYSLYLWHWPVTAFSNYWKTAPFSLSLRWVIVGVSLFLAILSWRYVETPFRRKNLAPTRKAVFGWMSAASLLAALLGYSFMAKSGFQERFSDEDLLVSRLLKEDFDARQSYSAVAKNVENIIDIERDSLTRLGLEGDDKAVNFVVLGDSHAGCATPVFDRLGNEMGLSGVAITYQGTPPLLDWSHRYNSAARNPDEFWKAALKYIEDHAVGDVFLLAYWSDAQKVGGVEKVRYSLIKMIDVLNNLDVRVWVVQDWPTYNVDMNRAVLKRSLFPFLSVDIPSVDEAQHRREQSAIFELAKGTTQARFLDPAPFMLNPNNNNYDFMRDDKPLYFDDDHLTIWGAETALGPVIEKAFLEINARGGRGAK